MKKINVIQIGTTHEHAEGIMYTLRRMTDVYNVLGVVEDRFCKTSTLKKEGWLQAGFDGLKRFSLEEALTHPDVDAYFVEVPNDDLIAVAEMCLATGKPLHMDKPVGLDLDRYKALLDRAEAENLPFQMGYMFRGNPAFMKLQELAKHNCFGDILEIHGSMSHNYGGEPYQDYAGNFRGGVMYILGNHMIDQFVSLLGEPDDVTSFLTNAPCDKDHIANTTMAVLSYPHAHAMVHVISRDPDGTPRRRFRLAGTKGTFELMPIERFDKQPLKARVCFTEDNEFYSAGEHIIDFGIITDRYNLHLGEFADIVHGKIKDPYTRRHDYLVHKITLAASGVIKYKK